MGHGRPSATQLATGRLGFHGYPPRWYLRGAELRLGVRVGAPSLLDSPVAARDNKGGGLRLAWGEMDQRPFALLAFSLHHVEQNQALARGGPQLVAQNTRWGWLNGVNEDPLACDAENVA